MSRLPDPASLERPWLASYPPGVPPDYRVPSVALPRLLDDAARDFPSHPAVSSDGVTVDHATLRARVAAVAGTLAGHGVTTHARVLVALPNGHTCPVVLLALWRLGAIPVPVDPARVGEDLAAIAADASVAAVVGTDAPVRALSQRDALPPLAIVVTGEEWEDADRRGRWSRLRRVLWRAGRRVARGSTPPDGVIRLADELGDPSTPAPAPAPHADDAALLAYHGRGDALRAVVPTHGNLVAGAFQTRLWLPDVQAGHERVLVADPLHQLTPMTLGWVTGLLSAACVVLVDDPDPATLARTIERDAPTLFPTTPARLAALAADRESGRRDLTSLRVCLASGEPIDAATAAALEQVMGGARVREGFGIAETGSLTHAQPVYGRVVPGTIGLPVTATVATILDPDDLVSVRPPGVVGRLAIHGPQVVATYWQGPHRTAVAFRDGWLVTDDLAVMDAEGVFTHVGRTDEVLERAGTVVAPARVETTLERHPDVRDAGAVITDDGVLVAAVVLRRRAKATPDALLAHCRTQLAVTAVPDRVVVVDHLPVTGTGELARDVLCRDLAER